MDKVNGAAFVKSLAAAHMQSNPPLEGDYIDEDGLLPAESAAALSAAALRSAARR